MKNLQAKPQSWIFNSYVTDMFWFYLPGLFAFSLTKYITESESSILYIAFAWLALGLLDAGHIYTTLWRTYFDPKELSRRSLYYKITPILIFCICALWIFLGGFLLGALIVYFTLYHNIRQFYGMSKWYQKINQSYNKTSDYFFYALCVAPILTFHFRDIDVSNYYYQSSIFLNPNDDYKNIFMVFNLFLFSFWLIYEVLNAAKIKKIEKARLLSQAYPIFLYSSSFLLSRNLTEVLFPLVVSHGLSYIALVYLSLKRTQKKHSHNKLVFYLLLTAIAFGSFEFFNEEAFVDLSAPQYSFNC